MNYTGTDPYIALVDKDIDDSGGNNNGHLDPGETVNLTATITNIGGVDFTTVWGTVETSDPYLTITDNSGTFGALPIDSTATNTGDPFVIRADSSAPQGHAATCNLIVTDNTCYTDELHLWFGVVTELGILGAPLLFYPNKEAWIEKGVIPEPGDLRGLEIPDFYTAGLMPRIHRFYEVLGEYAEGKLRVMFPEWVRGPFCLASHLRGMESFLMDLLLSPDSARGLMDFIVEAQKHQGDMKKLLKRPWLRLSA